MEAVRVFEPSPGPPTYGDQRWRRALDGSLRQATVSVRFTRS